MYSGKQVLLDRADKQMDILDIGVGKGQDLMKFCSARIKLALCLDINEAGLFTGSDGAISRYNVMMKNALISKDDIVSGWCGTEVKFNEPDETNKMNKLIKF